GIGLTAWLNQTYESQVQSLKPEVIGGAEGMIRGFESIFGHANQVHIIVSEEAATYRPEMTWLAEQLNQRRPATFNVQSSTFNSFAEGDAVYRFFELFDLKNVENARQIFELATEKKIQLTAPP